MIRNDGGPAGTRPGGPAGPRPPRSDEDRLPIDDDILRRVAEAPPIPPAALSRIAAVLGPRLHPSTVSARDVRAVSAARAA